ncbi:hypothetical protein [Rhodopirellula halodulae]|uniref:hypothetical protein n=1 Tax=Rhodopirellula halodulae TaxID=2894198 RepID=UPI001E3FBFBA|nr:hypothetical protein [Rhodopirellula sp. JC737]MCC9657910.1 hypothetical protein [Rhodopirellula sp. JC737]
MAASGQELPPPRRTSRFKTALVLLVVCLTTGLLLKSLLPQTVGEQARRFLEKKLDEHYADWDVSVHRGTFLAGTGLVFEQIEIRPKSNSPRLMNGWWAEHPAVSIDRLTVFADLDPQKWMNGESPLNTRRMAVEGVVANLDVGLDNSLSLASLLPLPQMGPACPRIDLHNVITNVNFETARARPNAARHVVPTNGPGSTSPSGQPLQLRWSSIAISTETGVAANREQPAPVHKLLFAKGESSFSGPIEFALEHQASGAEDPLRIKTTIQAFQLDETVVSKIRPRISQWFPDDSRVSLRGDLSAEYNRVGETDDFEIDLVVHQGNLADKRLPASISNARGRLLISPQQIKLYPTQALFGDAHCTIRGTTQLRRLAATKFDLGLTDLQLTGEGLTLDRAFAEAMPEKVHRLWQRYQARGRLNLRAHATNPAPLTSKAWALESEVDIRGVDVQFDRFPYPVQQLVGTIHIADGFATTERLTGRAGGQRLNCAFRVPVHLNPDAPKVHTKQITVQTEGAVLIDDALITALTPREESEPSSFAETSTRSVSKVERFVRSLRPRGAVEWATATLQTDASGKSTRQFDFRVSGGTLRYDKFPYPLYNVEGRVQIKDNLVRLIGFTANNAGSAKVDCNGLYQIPVTPDPDKPTTASPQESDLHLRFQLVDLAMDQSLRGSLPESTRHIWDSLAPGGTLDRLDVHIHQSGTQPLDLTLVADQNETEQVTPDSLSLRPTAVPYRMDIIGGHVEYRDHQVLISNLIGRHDASRLVADGKCVQHPSGRWLLSMDLHSGCRLVPDEEFVASLPEQVGRALRALDLRGPISLRGKTNLLLADDDSTTPIMDWDVLLQLEGNRIADVGPVHSLRGEIQVQGVRDAEVLQAYGNMALDSMHAYGLQITSVRGPFSITNEQLLLGENAKLPPSNSPDSYIQDADGSGVPIVGALFGGKLSLSGGVLLSTGDFEIDTALGNAQIATCLAEVGQSRTGITGRFDGDSHLEGRLGDLDLLKGSGRGSISGANLYQLPYLVQVLNLLRIKATEDVAFTNGETEFSIFGEDLNFNRLVLWGDLVALEGGGTLSRREHLDLSFNTRVSPQNLFSKVISPLRDNRYTLWTIEVDGPIEAPTIRRRSLSGITQTMEDWFPGMVRATTADGTNVNR